MKTLDLIIIGGGPTGLNCGISAQQRQLDYLILEKQTLVNSIYHFPVNMTFFSTSQRLEIGGIPFISHGEKPTRSEALEYYRRLQQTFDLKVKYYEPVIDLLPDEKGYLVKTSKGDYLTKAIIVATGFYDTPRKLNVSGENLPKVTHYYNDPHPYVGQNILVIGAANSACDVALETYYKGANVTMAIREKEIYPKVKYWIKPNIENRIKEGSIQAFFETKVKAIAQETVTLENAEGEFSIANDFVLAMIGYQPNYPLLEHWGLRFSDDEHNLPIHNLETLETNLPNVYLAGVVCAGKKTSQLFIENTRDHGDIIMDAILKKRSH